MTLIREITRVLGAMCQEPWVKIKYIFLIINHNVIQYAKSMYKDRLSHKQFLNNWLYIRGNNITKSLPYCLYQTNSRLIRVIKEEDKEGGDIGIHIADLLHCTAETNTTL